jgi:hypothetical protein
MTNQNSPLPKRYVKSWVSNGHGSRHTKRQHLFIDALRAVHQINRSQLLDPKLMPASASPEERKQHSRLINSLERIETALQLARVRHDECTSGRRNGH